MTDGVPLRDGCNEMAPAGYLELWRPTTEGPYGPGRFESGSFGVCLACVRRAFLPVRNAELARQRWWHQKNRWLRLAVHEREHLMALAEAIVRDAELEIGGAS